MGGLPAPPRFDLWPEALRSAELRRGTLVACGPGMRGVGWPDSPRVRLAALAPWLSGGRVAAFRTAAWVWGAAREPGRPLRVTTVGRGRHSTVGTEQLRVHELRLSSEEVVRFGPFGATSPFRTALDLLYDPEHELTVTERVMLRLLFSCFEGGAEAVRAHLHDHPRPHRAVALQRLAAVVRYSPASREE